MTAILQSYCTIGSIDQLHLLCGHCDCGISKLVALYFLKFMWWWQSCLRYMWQRYLYRIEKILLFPSQDPNVQNPISIITRELYSCITGTNIPDFLNYLIPFLPLDILEIWTNYLHRWWKNARSLIAINV